MVGSVAVGTAASVVLDASTWVSIGSVAVAVGVEVSRFFVLRAFKAEASPAVLQPRSGTTSPNLWTM